MQDIRLCLKQYLVLKKQLEFTNTEYSKFKHNSLEFYFLLHPVLFIFKCSALY